VLVIKWVICGKEKPAEYPLWSAGVWKAEFVVDCVMVLGGLSFLQMSRGTPYLPFFLRLLGAKIGSDCYLDTIILTEPDMVHIGDECCIGDRVTLQSHLFEDRVMKIDRMFIGDRVTVGALSIVLYNTHLGTGSSVGALSLVMKGEAFPPRTHWAGIPAEQCDAPAVMLIAARVPQMASGVPGITVDLASARGTPRGSVSSSRGVAPSLHEQNLIRRGLAAWIRGTTIALGGRDREAATIAVASDSDEEA